MATAKVILNGTTLMDVTQDTVTSATLVSGETATKADGTSITGSLSLTPKTSADLTASGATVTAPAGSYAEDATKTIASGSATTPATTITANPSISVNSSTGVITATVSGSQSVTPTVSAGYVSSGTSGTITVSGSNTSNLTTRAAQVIYPSTSDQTIASGSYLTGSQTIKGVTIKNLVPENIKNGVTISIGDSYNQNRIASVTGTYMGESSYSITVSLTNAQGTSFFGSVEIMCDAYTPSARTLGTITTPNGSATVDYPQDANGLTVEFIGSWVGYAPQYATTTCTGGVTHTGGTESYLTFSVTGDGTITVDGVDWEYDY